MDEGAFGVDKEDVWNPDLLHQSGVERPALVVVRRKRQPLVLPVVTQIKSHGEVLKDTQESFNLFHQQCATKAQQVTEKFQLSFCYCI